ncbi:VOC family protein [Pectobacterium brasiliense]|uniref:VOC family protein n=1 Tax=Pectobacterium TaxID=122277 RepID=UPI001968E5C4|nr:MULTISPECIES: VOC family protein [Pectobacterium]MBN3189852.1 VOC family protein [Pectobacterium brasiliense]MCL6328959.1 VOC family protein [Pectobacterium carotovorum subsp. carotovorum]
MSTLLLDHVVHYVNNLQDAIKVLTTHRLHAFPGGSHPGWGTHNALSYFGLTYVEFLSIRDADELAAARDSFLLSREIQTFLPALQVLHRVALRSDDIEAHYADLQSQGLTLSPLIAGQRHDKQGNLIEWRMFTIDGDFQGVAYPFIIQWGEPDNERLHLLRERGVERPHPAGDVTLQSLIFKVRQPEEVAAHWQKVFHFSLADLSANELRVGDSGFIFQRGEEDALTAVQLETNSPELINKSLFVGDGEYQFVAIGN